MYKVSSHKDLELGDISARPCHAVLLLHEESRDALSKLLVMVNEFVQYTNSASFELPNVPESLPLLLRYAKNVLSSEPVALKDVLAFLAAIKSEDLGKDLINISHSLLTFKMLSLQEYKIDGHCYLDPSCRVTRLIVYVPSLENLPRNADNQQSI